MAEENISELEDRYEKITNNAAGSECKGQYWSTTMMVSVPLNQIDWKKKSAQGTARNH